MKNIRKNVFETNSSSTHSITVAEAGELVNDLPSEDGVVYCSGDEFGWEEDSHYDSWTKLNYLMTAIFHDTRKDQEIELSPAQQTAYDKLKDAVKQFTGLDIEPRPDKDDYSPMGYIDHQSDYVAWDVLDGDIHRIQSFIFNPRSYLTTDNDNH